MVHYTECPVCGSNNFSFFLKAKDYTVSGEEYEIMKCNGCSFAFTQNVPSEDAIGPYYQSDAYISHSDTNKGITNKLYHIVRKRTLSAKQKLLQHFTGKTNGAVLDIGSGTGAFLNQMKASGWYISGIEADGNAREMGQKLYGIESLATDNLFSFREESFDAITMWHVLEHVHRLQDYLQQIQKILKPKGKLFIAVPNYTSTDAEIYKEHWAAYDVPRHLYHFSPQSMELLMGKNGFKLVGLKPMWYDSFYVSLLSEQYKHGKANFVSAIVSGIKSNFAALGKTAKCSSVIYIMEKA